MKLTTLLLIVNFLQIGATTYSQSGCFNLKVDQQTIKEVLSAIEDQSNYKFVYRDKDIADKRISIKTKDAPIDQVLTSVLSNTGMNFQILENNLIVIAPSKEIFQHRITGAVTDNSTKEPLIGVSVVIEGTTQGTVTDSNGKFSIDVPDANMTLIFSYVGYTSQKIKLAGQTALNISMSPEFKSIGEIVVVGYGTQRKADVTGAANRLTESDMNMATATSPTEMMQGRVAGVDISSNNGEPGAGLTVHIRGTNSIRAGQEPLYVVDGIPLDNSDLTPSGSSTVSGISGSAETNPLSFLNPDDIESIDILKDASSTAIYGSRGANGVVFITTKKGRKGKGNISYDGYIGYSSLPKKIDVLSASEFRAYRTAATNSPLPDLGASNNWQDLIFRTAQTQSHTFTYGGGTENGSFRASLGYLNQQGIVNTTGMQKFNSKIQVSQKFFNDHLNISGNLIVSQVKDRRAEIGETGGYEGDVILTALKLNPTYPIFNSDGTYYQNSTTQRNPLAMLNLTNDITLTDHILGNITAEFNVTKNLKYKLNLGWDHTVAERRINEDSQLTYLANLGECNINGVNASNHLIENYITYTNTFGDHSLTLLAGHAYQYFLIKTTNFYENGFAHSFAQEGMLYTDALVYGNTSAVQSSSSAIENELQSFFGRVNYDFRKKYYFTATFREDGSSKFGQDQKYGAFPSASIAWRISDEDFLKSFELLDNLKLRVGYGRTGNQEIPPKISLAILGAQSDANGLFNSNGILTSGLTFLQTPNPKIAWEVTDMTDAGLDFGLFKDRISGTFDYFHKVTSNVLLQVPQILAPTSTGWYNLTTDQGFGSTCNIINDGLEIGLNGVIIKQKDFNWDASLNFSTIKNDVKNLPVAKIQTGTASGQGLTGVEVQVIANNQPLGTFYGRVWEGYDANGISKYKKDVSGVNDTLEFLGTALPKFTYSFSTRASYKNFDLSMFWYGSQGNKVYDNMANALFVKGSLDKGSNVTKEVADSKESVDDGNTFSSRFIEDGSFLRLANLTLGYNFKIKAVSWLSSGRVYVTGNNLLLITNYKGYDPEVNSNASINGVPSIGINYTNYPKDRTFTVGVSLKF